MGASFWQDPYPVYRSYQQRSGVFWDEMLEAWIVTGRETTDTVLRSPAFSSDWHRLVMEESAGRDFPDLDRTLAGWFMLMDPPQHTRLRRSVQPWFTRARAEGMRDAVRALAAERVARVRDLERIDLMGDFAAPLAAIILAAVLHVPVAVVDRAAPCMKALASFLAQPHKQEFARTADAAVKELNRLFGDLAPCLPPDSPLYGLVEREGNGPGRTYLDTAQLLSFAGLETTAGLIGTGLLHLIGDPALYDAVRRGEATPEEVVEELVRFDTPVPQVPRVAVADTEVDGNKIRAGDRVVVLLAAANRDWEHSEDADVLRFDRQQRHLAFGIGVHYCLGAPIARMGTVVAVEQWTAAFPRVRVVPDGVRWSVGTGYRGLDSALTAPF